MNPRLRSLDVFRGAAVALMILVNNPGSWEHLYPPLAHAAWHGLTPTDLVFPAFLFAVGMALALVMQRPQPAPAFWARVARRSALIFGVGLLLNASPFVRWDAAGELALRSWDNLRVMGVLQRIALAFGAAALIVGWAGRRGAVWGSVLLLLGYWGACLAFGARGDPYGLEGFFGTALDRAWLGPNHLYQGEGVPFDPEGLASTLPAVAQVLLGWSVGDRIARHQAAAAPPTPLAGLLVRLFVAATWLLVIAYIWQLVLPLNKKIWTPSYVLATTGFALLALAALMHALERRPEGAPLPGWARALEVFGLNALFVFVLSGLVPRVLALVRWPHGVKADGGTDWTSPLPWIHEQFFAGLASDPRLGSLLFACANLALYWALAAALARRRLFIRV